MADPDWPAEFPQKPLTQGLAVGVAAPLDRTQTEHTLPIARARSSTPVVPWQVTWRFDNDGASPTQWQLFVAWVNEYLNGGELPFNWPVWDGTAFVSKRTWIVGDVAGSAGAAGLYVIAPAQLLIVDPPRLSKATLDANIT